VSKASAAFLMVAASLFFFSATSEAFSVLAHQAIVDEAWEQSLIPLLHKRFPNASDKDLTDARSYARGGSHLPDLGYFPLGSHQFTDMLHYVCMGDFVGRLLAEANTVQEYAFALGVMDHYYVDTIGHPLATNLAVPILYPKLAQKHGYFVTYADSPSAHLQTEFRFDVLQVARRGEVPDRFEHSIEFKVPREFLERVFKENYGLELNDLFKNYEVAIATYRWGFRALIDEVTGIAWELYRSDIQSLEPGMVQKNFLKAMSRSDFEKQFGKAFREPGYFARFIGVLGNLVPNIGPFARLPYKPLPDKVKQLYIDAFHKASEQYAKELAVVATLNPRLANLNLDTGQPVRAGEYSPADKAYAQLLRLHAKDHFARMPKPLAASMVGHFQNRDAALKFDESKRDREKTLDALKEFDSLNQRDATMMRNSQVPTTSNQ
jgi:hypothetical protein